MWLKSKDFDITFKILQGLRAMVGTQPFVYSGKITNIYNIYRLMPFSERSVLCWGSGDQVKQFI